ncbi:hypothetical protein [Massilia phyllosphaerae]|uniref:hypothetical protein n=1 Tax=Massilia phyllosphaerae TaxID=3106034 RepID=UPI002B1CB12B|nr:hypothetical protein [Massilia sp. SGZ-792]
MMRKAVPKAVVKLWGESSPEAFEFLIAELEIRGFEGPLTWAEKYSIPFCIYQTAEIRVQLSLSRCGTVSGMGLFDSGLLFGSKTLYMKTLATDPWWVAPPSENAGQNKPSFEPCLTDSLAHQKWAEQPGEMNPAWLMTLDKAVPHNVYEWLVDFDRHHMPMILKMVSDEALIKEMRAALDYRRPHWVRSDGPHCFQMHERLAAFER